MDDDGAQLFFLWSASLSLPMISLHGAERRKDCYLQSRAKMVLRHSAAYQAILLVLDTAHGGVRGSLYALTVKVKSDMW